MQMQLRPGSQRGSADYGWLDTRHTFSFAGYWDPRWMGFGPLRVINEDRVAPSRGFGLHPHRDMEIISYVVEGELAHRDSAGGGGVLRRGDVQVMSAGSGVVHSEMNPSPSAPVHFLQIWLLPARPGGPASYDQRHFEPSRRGAVLLASPDGADGSLRIGQDAELRRLLLEDESLGLPSARGRAWVQVVRGELMVEGALLRAGDGAGITGAPELRLTARGAVEALAFDLP